MRSHLEACVGGDRGAFDLLVRRHQREVYRLCYRFVGNHEDASELAQDAFVRAYRALPKFERTARFSTWLHRIAINASLMKLRTKKREIDQDVEQEMELLQPRFVGLGAHASSQRAFSELPEEGIVREETCSFVRECIHRLPEPYRTALLLRDIEGFDNEEVARRLDISVNAAKIRVHRARQALRTLLAPRLGESVE